MKCVQSDIWHTSDGVIGGGMSEGLAQDIGHVTWVVEREVSDYLYTVWGQGVGGELDVALRFVRIAAGSQK